MLVNTNYQSNTNFRALNAVRFESEVFKRYPESRNIIMNAFNKNSAIKNFSDYFSVFLSFKYFFKTFVSIDFMVFRAPPCLVM